MQIAQDSVVSIHYTLKNDAGEVLDSSEGAEPLVYMHGNGNLIPGLEQALMGKSAGEKLAVSIAPDQAYGERDASLVQEVPRSAFRNVQTIEVGMQFQADSNQGPRMVTVVQVTDTTVTVDGNHPLAGEQLHFTVEITEVRAATQEELDHGHVHGPGGHHHH
jgi:FKBP-type peptidyl-prolyl cis-trans isomerase SlyD